MDPVHPDAVFPRTMGLCKHISLSACDLAQLKAIVSRIKTFTASQVVGLSKQPRDELAHASQALPEHHPPNLIQGLVPRNTKRQVTSTSTS